MYNFTGPEWSLRYISSINDSLAKTMNEFLIIIKNPLPEIFIKLNRKSNLKVYI